MSQPFEFDVEAEAVPASHLMRVRCACGQMAYAAAERVTGARCAACLASGMGGVDLTPLRGSYSVARGYPVARRWNIDYEPEAREPYPAPRRLDTVTLDLFPSAVVALARDALTLGWGIASQAAVGAFGHRTTGRPGVVKDSYALRIQRGGGQYRAYAVYAGSGWESCAVWDLAGKRAPFVGVSVTDLRDWLAAPRGDAWYARIRERQQEQRERQRAAAAGRTRTGGQGA